MFALNTPSTKGKDLTPRSNPVADRKALRDELSKRYEHTLRRLAK